MNRDEQGVAGFFEDLPVLLFVLAGTLTIVISALSASKAIYLRDVDKELERLAERCVELVLSSVQGQGREAVATVGCVCSTKLNEEIDEFLADRGFCMSILMVHPELKWLVQESGLCAELPERACSASRFFNALMGDGRIAILEVRIIVW